MPKPNLNESYQLKQFGYSKIGCDYYKNGWIVKNYYKDKIINAFRQGYDGLELFHDVTKDNLIKYCKLTIKLVINL